MTDLQAWLAGLTVALAGLWIGGLGAGVRREIVLLGSGASPAGDYALVALLQRLREDPTELGLKFRVSRTLAAVWVPLGLGIALYPSWSGLVLAVAAGWLLPAALEAAGGGGLCRGLGRMNGGLGYGAWARLTRPLAKAATVLLERRPAMDGRREGNLVLAESHAAASPAGGRLGLVERRFLRRLLASTSILVADIMTSWDLVHTVDAPSALSEAAAVLHRAGKSRLPVVKDGRVVGLLNVREVLPALRSTAGAAGTVGARARPAYHVRQEETVKDLLDELRAARVHLAVVVDRLGRPVGIVTMEDVLEEIVGEIHDERERPGAVR